VHSLVRSVLVVTFLAVAPTVAIAGLLSKFDLFARIVLAFVANLALVALIAMVLLSQGLWSPGAGLIAMAVVTTACLAVGNPGAYRELAARVRNRSPVRPPELPAPSAQATMTGSPDQAGPIARTYESTSQQVAHLIEVAERLQASDDPARRQVGSALYMKAKELAASDADGSSAG
jgi:hypothetical protein